MYAIWNKKERYKNWQIPPEIQTFFNEITIYNHFICDLQNKIRLDDLSIYNRDSYRNLEEKKLPNYGVFMIIFYAPT